jgi:hypothetical protein
MTGRVSSAFAVASRLNNAGSILPRNTGSANDVLAVSPGRNTDCMARAGSASARWLLVNIIAQQATATHPTHRICVAFALIFISLNC